jgi:DNA primase
MASIDYAALRRRIAVRRILELINYQPTIARGDQWRGSCPIADHAYAWDRHRCFSVHVTRNVFRCFRCGKSGNQLDLWAAITRQPLHPASLDLCRRLDIDVPAIVEIRNSKTGPP